MILTVNTGSSSVRLAVFARHERGLAEVASVRHELRGEEPGAMLHAFAQAHGLGRVEAAAHRVVHGGERFTASRALDPETERELGRLASLAPLHNPVALRWVRAVRAALNPALQVAVFDTAFFAALPEAARTYAIPYALAGAHGVRRYGFHGLAHEDMWRTWRARTQRPGRGGRVISLQLGAGCSIAAIEDGVPRDTSMGFSPLEGLVMATRSGDVDPFLATYLQRRAGFTPEEVERMLNERSGLLGVSGISADLRELLASRDPRACLAVDLYCHRIRKYVGAYLALLGGADAVVFGGGVGENLPEVRARILARMAWCGLEIDPGGNENGAGAFCISTAASRIEAWVVPVNEAAILAREAARVMAQPDTQATSGGDA